MEAALKQIAEFMVISARTAPKSGGKDFVTAQILEGELLRKLGEAMIQYGEEMGIKGFIRDGKNVLDSSCVVLIGIKDAQVMGLNCGGCGFDTCEAMEPKEKREFKGPQCMLRLLDLGIALGSAVKTASLFNVDNRIMYRIGVVARRIGLTQDDVVMGIPLSARGKNIYFDRKD
ncbi:MAG: ferredoxin domain-containing protein [Methanomassiliicoccales archaeon]